jgi:hypothetical protein
MSMMGLTGKSSIECNNLIVHLILVVSVMFSHIYLNILQIVFILSCMITSEHLTFIVVFRQGCSGFEKSWRHQTESWTSYIIHTVDYLQDFFTWGYIQNKSQVIHVDGGTRKLSRPHLTNLCVNDRVQRECRVIQNFIILRSGGPQSANWHWLCSRKYSPFKTTQKFQYVLLKTDNSSKLSLVN